MSSLNHPSHARTEVGQSRGSWALVAVLLAVAATAVTAGIVMGVTPWSTAAAPSPDAVAAPSPTPTPSPSVTPEPEPEPVQFTVVTAGDVLPHMPVINSARSGDSYDFEPLWSNIRPFIENADLAICHKEVPITPPGGNHTGYPIFSAPAEMVRDLGKEGWTGCSTASNHTVDKGFDGLITMLDTFDEYGMGHSGSARTEEESEEAQMYVVSDGLREITVANISFSYGTNGMPLPSGAPWALNLFNADASEAQPIIDAAQAARDAGADVVIASVHCCVEYMTQPTPAQRLLVERIAESGTVDLYVGHHAHVPQPIELMDGGPNGDGMWAAFGLGNYISNQDTQCCVAATNSGLLMTATFTVDVDMTVTVEVDWTAITVDRHDSHTMHVLREILDGAGNLSSSEANARLNRVSDAAGTEAPERTEPPTQYAESVTVVPRAGASTES